MYFLVSNLDIVNCFAVTKKSTVLEIQLKLLKYNMYTAEFQKVFVQLIIMSLLFRLNMADNPWNVADATMFLKVEKIFKR